MTRKTVAERAGAQVRRGFHQRRIEALQGRVDRQHHEGQIAVDQSEQHRAVVVEQRQRSVDEAQLHAARY